MLEGIKTNPVMVGADGDPRGGVCPIYAASNAPSKRIGRPFARAWDRYAGAWLPRRASERELGTLRSMLETSIEREAESEVPEVSLRAGIVAHKASRARSQAASRAREAQRPAPRPDSTAPRPDTGEQDRTGELARRHGWAWLRPVRRYDDYERALRALDEMAREAGSESEPERLVASSYGRG
jgi:hypothetical protein